LGGSAGTDVTGGMRTKVQDLLRLVEAIDRLQVRIMSGTQAGLLTKVLLGERAVGTRIVQD
jgi:isopentenyl phosphate kinase